MKWLLAFIAGGMLTTAGCVKKGLTADDCPPGKVISWSTGQCIDNPANVPR